MRILVVWILPLAMGAAATFAAEPDPSLLRIPSSLTADHKALHENLEQARQAGGEVAVAAEELAARLGPHFRKEEEFALPQLGLLTELTKGGVTPAMRPAIEMGERLRADYGQMLKEHEEIRRSADNLREAALAENRPEFVRFADSLALHARMEEQVLYPAAILVGEKVRAELEKTE